MQFLSEPWCTRVMSSAGNRDVGLRDATINVAVSGAPTGLGRIHARLVDGALVALGTGTDDETDAVGDIIELKTSWADATKIAKGDLDANVAYMLGTVKTEGATGPLLELLRVLTSDDARAGMVQLAGDTTFD